MDEFDRSTYTKDKVSLDCKYMICWIYKTNLNVYYDNDEKRLNLVQTIE